MIKYMIFDTETTGLNIVKDKPFLFQYGLVDEKLNLLSIESFKAGDDAALNLFKHYLDTVPTLVGQNIKFDVHMCLNYGISEDLFKDKNYIDTAWLARLVVNHDKQSDASFSTALKKLALRYLGVDAADEERKLKQELSALTIEHKNKLLEHLKAVGVFPATKTQREDTRIINDIYNSWNKVYHLYSKELKDARNKWLKLHPAPTYENVANVITYGEKDIELTHGLFKMWYPQVVLLKQVPTFTRLNKATWPLILMERKGLSLNLQQVLKDRAAIIKEMQRVKIIDPRTGEEYSVGQHAKLKDLYEYESGIQLESSDKNARELVMGTSDAAAKAEYLSKMSKYLNTYITGILNKLTDVNGEWKVFTQYNMAGTVTGRLSSDFQQFPKEPLELENGYVVDIRSWFVVPKGNKYMFYFDYSQLELRLQCEWTAIVQGSPDINLARAFSPYKTITVDDKHYLEEDPNTEWKPTDLHSMTAKHAFGVDETDPNWGHYRQLGKRANFA